MNDIIRDSQDPALKWVGGKRWLVPLLQKMWKDNSSSRLVEPFVGGMAVTLGLQPKSALLNDANPHLINFYRHVQAGLEVTIPMENSESFYYNRRNRFNQLTELGLSDTNESAQLFYYLITNTYNGLCRFNNSGGFNSPFGSYPKINYAQNFFEYRASFTKYEFVNGDFEELILKQGDIVYADPPYDTPFTKYTKKDFTWDDQIRLIKYLNTHQGKIIASNQATDRILDLYQSNGFAIEILNAPRKISRTGDRTPAKEMLAFKGF